MKQLKNGVYKGDRMINHRPPFKVWINNFLRTVQFWTKNKYIIASSFAFTYQGGILIKEELTGYKLAKIEHRFYLPRRYNKEILFINSCYS